MKPNVLDVFHGDNKDRPINWSAVVADGFHAVFHKISQGRNEHDPLFVVRIVGAQRAALEIGGYHFLTNETDGATQFRFCYSILRAIHDLPDNFQIAGDYEDYGAKSATPQILYDFLCTALDAGFLPWAYGGNRIRETISNNKEWRNKFMVLVGRGVKLWLAEYGPHENIPLPWYEPNKTIWQWSDTTTEPGIIGHVDVNYCPGDLTALWVNKKASPIAVSNKPAETKPMGDTMSEIDRVLTDAQRYLPFLSPLLGAVPGATGYLALAQTILGAVDNAIKVVQSVEGKSTADAITTVLQHLTPGQPNASSLTTGGTEAGAVDPGAGGPGSMNAGAGNE